MELQERLDLITQVILVELLDIWVKSNKIAPEVMCRQNHGIGVDYFALGVIAYEFMLGKVYIYKSETIYWKIKERDKRCDTF